MGDPMDPLIVLGAILSGWVVLALLGCERQRRIREIELQLEAARLAEPKPSEAASAAPRRNGKSVD